MLQNLDRIKIFYNVFSAGSVAAASEALHISQSAVSQALQKLEKELQTPLFTRLHKKLVPTSAGKDLYAVVQPFMSELGVYLNSLRQSKEYPAGELHIGAPPEFGKAYLSLLIAEFRELHPDVTFSLEFGTPEKLLPLLKEGEIDFILLDEFLARNPVVGSLEAFLFEPVVDEEIILACSRLYFDRHIRDDLSFDSLSKQNFIGYSEGSRLIRQWFKKHFSKQNTIVKRVLTVDNHAGVVSAIMHNIGMGIVASQLVKDELQSGRMVKIQTSEADIINSISLVQLLDKIPSLTEKTFAAFMVNRIREMITAGFSNPEAPH